MSGLLGYLKAGVAGGAGAAAKVYEDQANQNQKVDLMNREFDMKQQLLEAEQDMRLRLEEAGIKMKEDAIDRQRAKVKEVTDSVKDPNDGKGGYESPAMKDEREYGLLKQKREALREAGYYDESKSYDTDILARDKTALKERELDLKQQSLVQQQERYNADRDSREKIEEARQLARLAQIEAQQAKGEKKTDLERVAEAASRIGTPQERKTDKHIVDLYKRDKPQYDTVTESEEVYDEETGASKKVSTSRKVPRGGQAQSSSGGKPWERFNK